MYSLTVAATSYSSAPARLVHSALLDAESWPSWTSFYEVQWELPAGVERPARAGDLRGIRSRLGGVCCREQRHALPLLGRARRRRLQGWADALASYAESIMSRNS